MDDKEVKDIYKYYSLGRKHEKEDFKNYVLYYINTSLEINKKDIEELMMHNNIDAIKDSIEKTKAQNAILTILKDYIEIY